MMNIEFKYFYDMKIFTVIMFILDKGNYAASLCLEGIRKKSDIKTEIREKMTMMMRKQNERKCHERIHLASDYFTITFCNQKAIKIYVNEAHNALFSFFFFKKQNPRKSFARIIKLEAERYF